MIRALLISFTILVSTNVFAQRIIRSSIGTIGSSYKGSFSLVSGSPISSPVIQNRDFSNGITMQTRPFIHLRPSFSVSKIDITIYPNPSTDIVFVRTTAEYSSIKVTDLSGRLCYEGIEPKLSLGHLMSGVYTLEISLPNNGTYSQKLIINK
jgi:hypothetical protein